jgi:hypothetical protein
VPTVQVQAKRRERWWSGSSITHTVDGENVKVSPGKLDPSLALSCDSAIHRKFEDPERGDFD